MPLSPYADPQWAEHVRSRIPFAALDLDSVLAHPLVDAPALTELYDRIRHSEDFEVGWLYGLARHPRTPSNILTRLTRHQNHDVAGAAAGNPSTPADVIDFRRQPSHHPHRPRADIDRAAGSSDTLERILALSHPQLSPHLRTAQLEQPASVPFLLSNPQLTHTEAAPHLNHPHHILTWAGHLHADPEWLASTANAALRAADSDTVNGALLQKLTRNPATPHDVLTQLVVRPTGLDIVYHPRATVAHLQAGLAHPFCDRRGDDQLCALLTHPQTNGSVLEHLPWPQGQPWAGAVLAAAQADSPTHADVILSLSRTWVHSVAALLETARGILNPAAPQLSQV